MSWTLRSLPLVLLVGALACGNVESSTAGTADAAKEASGARRRDATSPSTDATRDGATRRDAGTCPADAARGVLSGPAMSVAMCNLLVTLSNDGQNPPVPDGGFSLGVSSGASTTFSFQPDGPAPAEGPSVGIGIPLTPAPGVYSSGSSDDCGGMLISYGFTPPGVSCEDASSPQCPPGCSGGFCVHSDCPPCTPILQSFSYSVESSGCGVGLVGAYTVTLTSVTDPTTMGMDATSYVVHGHLTAMLATTMDSSDADSSDAGTATLSLDF
jgi:hypothetical protein